MSGAGGRDDTELGGRGRDFPSTCWSRFLDGASRPGGAGRPAAETLAKDYWKPIYAYIRTKWAHTNEDAKDLTQDFFVWMMEGDFLSQADPSRGRFRAFVKVALKHYLADEARRKGSLKRGGGRNAIPIDVAAESLPMPTGSPEEALDQAWQAELLLRAAKRLEGEFRSEGKEVYYQVFRDFHLRNAAGHRQQEIAVRYGISDVDVGNYLKYAKRRFRAAMTDLVAETVQSDEDLQAELKALFGEDA